MKTEQDIEPFRALLESEQHQELLNKGYHNLLAADPLHAQTYIKMGRKFACVDVGGPRHRSGRYMVDLETGTIYGIKGYGVVHRGHQFGTLDTIWDWQWGGYRGIKKPEIKRPIIRERRTSPRTGDAVWMMFECGAGSRWTSTVEDWDGVPCDFNGCNCGTMARKVGETDDRRLNWFGLHAGKQEARVAA